MEHITSNSCFVCRKPTVNKWIFCSKCTPNQGELIHIVDNHTIYNVFVGKIRTFETIKLYLYNQKVIKWWMGTDVLTLIKFPPGLSKIKIILHRLKIIILEKFIYEHWCTSENLGEELIKFGIKSNKIKIVIHPPKLQTYLIKNTKEIIIVGYYLPQHKNQKYVDWVYGKDIINTTINNEQKVLFCELNGSLNMTTIYPFLNCLIRPTRHDGEPKMLLECDINKTPYYFSRSGNPNSNNIIKFINQIKNGETNNWID